jgi:hypothetical protein
MATPPKIPQEQTSFADHDPDKSGDAAATDRRDAKSGAQSPQPGDADVNLDQQGRFGNLKQNLTTHWQVQDR